MKISILKGELFLAEAALMQLNSMDLDTSLSCIVAKNLRLIGYEIMDLRKGIKFPKPGTFIDFENKQKALIRKHQNDREGYEKNLEVLYNEYPDVLEARDDHQLEVRKTLEMRYEVEVEPIPFKLLPKIIKPAALGPMGDAVTGGPLGK